MSKDGGPTRRRLLCLRGHGGNAERLCGKVESLTLKDILAAPGKVPSLGVSCRCIDAPFAEPSRRPDGRQWWRYEKDNTGDRPEDFAELEVSALAFSEVLHSAAVPYDGVLSFSQGAEMVHAIGVLVNRGDPRFTGRRAPRLGISLSGAVNPAHFEAPGAADAPPEGCPEPRPGPASGESSWPVLLVGDFVGDKRYSARRFVETQALYSKKTAVGAVPDLYLLELGGGFQDSAVA